VKHLGNFSDRIRTHKHRVDFTAILIIGVLALIYSGYSITNSGMKAEYFPRFQPAVQYACSGPFTNPIPPDYPHISARPTDGVVGLESVEGFLRHEVDRFDCADIPKDVEQDDLYPYQSMHEYSMRVVGTAWRIFGVNWTVVVLVTALLYSLSSTLIYAISRQFVGRYFSFATAMLFVTSTSALSLASTFRDFSKAPFLLAVILACTYLVQRPRPTRVILLVGLATGVFAGIGLGFRADVLMAPVLFSVVAVLLMPTTADSWRRKLAINLGVSGVFITAFVVSSLPILHAYEDDSFSYTSFQRAEGVVGEFNTRLGLSRYFVDLGKPYSDIFSFATMLGHAARSENESSKSLPDHYVDSEYGRELSQWSSDYYSEYVNLFPADALTRAIRATNQVATLPIKKDPGGLSLVPGLNAKISNIVWELSISILIVITALVLMFARNPRLGLLFGFFLLFFGSLATFQFDRRHLFYLEPLFWITLFTSMSLVSITSIHAIRRVVAEFSIKKNYRIYLGHKAYAVLPAIALAGIAGLVLLVAVAREVQDRRLESFLEQSLENRKAVPYRTSPSLAGRTMVLFTETDELGELEFSRGPNTPYTPGDRWAFAMRYLGVTFDSSTCDSAEGNVEIKYIEPPVFESEFDINLDHTQSNQTVLLFPTYYGNGVWFEGVSVPNSLLGCMSDVFEIPAANGIALTPFAQLEPEWRDQRSHLGF